MFQFFNVSFEGPFCHMLETNSYFFLQDSSDSGNSGKGYIVSSYERGEMMWFFEVFLPVF